MKMLRRFLVSVTVYCIRIGCSEHKPPMLQVQGSGPNPPRPFLTQCKNILRTFLFSWTMIYSWVAGIWTMECSYVAGLWARNIPV